MSEYLPYGGFKWVKVNNKTINRILNKSNNSLHGYFFGSRFRLSRIFT